MAKVVERTRVAYATKNIFELSCHVIGRVSGPCWVVDSDCQPKITAFYDEQSSQCWVVFNAVTSPLSLSLSLFVSSLLM